MTSGVPVPVSAPAYIDTHCHMHSERFAGDIDAVIRDGLAAGVRILAIGVDLESSRQSLAIAERHPGGVLASAGVHPTETGGLDEDAWAEVCALARSPKVAAIGETGLDYHWKNVPRETQAIWFRKHVELALELGKPLSVHARDSVADVLAVLGPALDSGVAAAWHCFAAGKAELGPAIAFADKHNLRLGIGGLATFEDQKALRRHIADIPERLLLLETDAPYLIPRPRRSDRNLPTGVIRVAEVLAELRGSTPAAIAGTTTRNAEDLFGFAPAGRG